MKFRVASHSSVGKRRKVNEDSLICLDSERLWAVADGMGGHSRGDYASRLITEKLSKYREHRMPGVNIAALESILEECNGQLVEEAAKIRGATIGSTVATLVKSKDSVFCIWSGDSRIYRLRNNLLKQLTVDHNYGSIIADSDIFNPIKMIEVNPELLTQAIGGANDLCIEYSWFRHCANDLYLICSDGLHGEISNSDLKKILVENSNRVSKARDMLVDAVYSTEARDNISFIILQ